MAFGLGVMGLGLDDFLDLTPFEFIAVKNRYLEQQYEQKKEQWEMTRWQVFRNICPPQPRTKGGYLKPRDFIVFPWEEKEVKKEYKKADPERVRRLIEKWK